MPSLASRSFQRILLIKPSAAGDVVHTLPVLVKLRARYPGARIDWLITPENAELVRCHPALSGVVLFDRRRLARFGRDWSAITGLFKLLWKIWRTRYDLVVDVHGQLRSAVFTLVSGARCRVGFQRAREGAWLSYSHRVPRPTMDVHAVDRYLWLSPLLGLDDETPDFTLHLPPDAERRVTNLLAEQVFRQTVDQPPSAPAATAGPRLAVLVPGTVWQTKHWRVEGFAAVGRYLLERGFAVVLAGAPRDRARCRRVAALCPGTCDLSGRTTLAEFAALIGRAALCVTNDSASMHLAAALGRPLVSVFGPTSALRTGPYRRPEAVVASTVSCAPCYLRKLRHCPHEHRCMHEITSDTVIARIEAVLTNSRPDQRAA